MSSYFDDNDDNEYMHEQFDQDEYIRQHGGDGEINPDEYSDVESGDEDDDDPDAEDDLDEDLQLLDKHINYNQIIADHPEQIVHNTDEVMLLSKIERDVDGNIVDSYHTTLPTITKYEKAKVIGMRIKQLNAGNEAFIIPPKGIFDAQYIATEEFYAKKIPFIIVRPIPGSRLEYWPLRELEILC